MKKHLKYFTCFLCALIGVFMTINFSYKIPANTNTALKAEKIITNYNGLGIDNELVELDALIKANALQNTIDKKINSIISNAKQFEKYNFQILSDVHMSQDNSLQAELYGDTYQYFIDALEYIARNYSDSSAVLIPGDITCTGNINEFKKYKQALEFSYNNLGLNLVLTAIGNHEFYNENDPNNTYGTRNAQLTQDYFTNTLNEYYKTIGFNLIDKVYYDTYINNNHFIVLGSEQDGIVPGSNPYCYAYISNEQLEWFEEKLAETNPNEPIFVMLHQPLDNTVHLSNIWGAGTEASTEIKKILAKYPQAILISGHVHNGIIGNDAVFSDGYGIMLDMPAFQYNEVFNPNSHIGYNVSVYTDRIIFTPIDFDNMLPILDKVFSINLELSERLSSYYDLQEHSSQKVNSNTIIKDFEKPIKMDGARICIKNGTMQSLKIEISDDNITYDDVFNGKLNYPSNNNKVYFNNEVTARYVKFTTSNNDITADFFVTWYKENKSQLREIYHKAKKFDKNEYSQENFLILQNAIESARLVIINIDATSSEILYATEELTTAFNNKNPITPIPPPPSQTSPSNNYWYLCVILSVVIVATVTVILILIKCKKK